jgi:hypothetical protein
MRALPTNVRNEMLRLLNVNSLEVRCATGIALAHLIRRLPDPPFASEEMLALADALSRLLKEIPARASWESETHLQNDLLIALDWIVTRARPSLPRLSAQSELEDLAR